MEEKDRHYDDLHLEYNRIAKLYNIKHTHWSDYSVSSMIGVCDVPPGVTICTYETNKTIEYNGRLWADLWRTIDTLVGENRQDFGDHIYIERLDLDLTNRKLNVSFGS